MPIDKLKQKYEIAPCPKIPPDHYIVAITDGHKFGELTSREFKRPFDPEFEDMMVSCARQMMVDPCGNPILMAYTKSDETSFLFPPGITYLGRLPDKISSIISSHMTAIFTKDLIKRNKKGQGIFYTNLLSIPSLKEVVDYFIERQFDGYINQLNSYAQHYLGKDVNGNSNLKAKELINVLKEYDLIFNQEKSWRKYGTLVYRKSIQHKKNEEKSSNRRIVTTKRDLELFKEGKPDLENLLIESMTPKMREYLRKRKLI